MYSDHIIIEGARENNLKHVSLRIPKKKINIFTGVSGSGKSSIVFDTIATEAQRQLNETFSAFIRGFLPKYAQPAADAIRNVSTAIIVDQKRLGGNSRSTLGTITDINPLFRVLFSRIGEPATGTMNVFSFNDPGGMCPACEGIGKKVGLDLEKFLDRSKSLNEGAILFPIFAVGTWYWKSYVFSGFFDADKPLTDYTPEEWHQLLRGKAKSSIDTPTGPMNMTYEGLLDKFDRLYIKKEGDMSTTTQKKVQSFITSVTCDACGGSRYNPAVLNCRIKGYNIADMMAMQVDELITVIGDIADPLAIHIVGSIKEHLQHLIDIGLDYVSLDRETTTLSGGESQRVKMVRHLSSSLTDVIYIFDEPSVGLHPRDVHRLNELLQKLRDKGNTVIVVEHDPDVIKVADHIVDVGPRAGIHGGQIVYEGDYQGLLASGTLTGRFMQHQQPIKDTVRPHQGYIPVSKSSLHNLKSVSVQIPTGVLTVVTGVAGSGKSTLINRVFLQQHGDAIVIDQSAVGASSRSNPATYTGIMDTVRQLFGAANKVSASLFSFNSKGACKACNGLGVILTDFAFMETIRTPCEVCNGQRFEEEVLGYRLHGKSISDVLAMSVSAAVTFFEKKDLRAKLQALYDVGLDYLTLGQPLSTLSGGECQRLKLASELHKQGSVYVMDEPTTGLHMSDTGQLLRIMNRLVDGGNTVIVIEHNLDVIRNADWIIDMGPEGGHKGGQVIFEGTPRDLLQAPQSLTGQYLLRS
ncbi:excinuclease ABC subunit UvrA [Chitinophaga pendula]|uniref:ATP-binding cassette domain-containing protein n=1 Tax=Chitinophaga TaxID=79328 RepID=UPI000BB04308|nr:MULTISPECIES: excinuclease ABC subunit UvrA [Chitinophaga]ASZ09818.1 thiamine ABC transporter permease [Chitinophaga sp. MD30]UCJ07241.1 excinuclease ABC subunit UvrA [Chitinophaga pendula]